MPRRPGDFDNNIFRDKLGFPPENDRTPETEQEWRAGLERLSQESVAYIGQELAPLLATAEDEAEMLAALKAFSILPRAVEEVTRERIGNYQPHIFVSYSHRNKPEARALQLALMRKGGKAVRDETHTSRSDGGPQEATRAANFEAAIGKMEDADFTTVVVTPALLDNPNWVLQEIEQVKGRGKEILLVYLCKQEQVGPARQQLNSLLQKNRTVDIAELDHLVVDRAGMDIVNDTRHALQVADLVMAKVRTRLLEKMGGWEVPQAKALDLTPNLLAPDQADTPLSPEATERVSHLAAASEKLNAKFRTDLKTLLTHLTTESDSDDLDFAARQTRGIAVALEQAARNRVAAWQPDMFLYTDEHLAWTEVLARDLSQNARTHAPEEALGNPDVRRGMILLTEEMLDDPEQQQRIVELVQAKPWVTIVWVCNPPDKETVDRFRQKASHIRIPATNLTLDKAEATAIVASGTNSGELAKQVVEFIRDQALLQNNIWGEQSVHSVNERMEQQETWRIASLPADTEQQEQSSEVSLEAKIEKMGLGGVRQNLKNIAEAINEGFAPEFRTPFSERDLVRPQELQANADFRIRVHPVNLLSQDKTEHVPQFEFLGGKRQAYDKFLASLERAGAVFGVVDVETPAQQTVEQARVTEPQPERMDPRVFNLVMTINHRLDNRNVKLSEAEKRQIGETLIKLSDQGLREFRDEFFPNFEVRLTGILQRHGYNPRSEEFKKDLIETLITLPVQRIARQEVANPGDTRSV